MMPRHSDRPGRTRNRTRQRAGVSATIAAFGLCAAVTAPAVAQDENGETPMAHADQSGMMTPPGFRFPGHMASIWTKRDAEGIN